jgi:hypothetical protein
MRRKVHRQSKRVLAEQTSSALGEEGVPIRELRTERSAGG